MFGSSKKKLFSNYLRLVLRVSQHHAVPRIVSLFIAFPLYVWFFKKEIVLQLSAFGASSFSASCSAKDCKSFHRVSFVCLVLQKRNCSPTICVWCFEFLSIMQCQGL